jgi:hypothetical protein
VGREDREVVVAHAEVDLAEQEVLVVDNRPVQHVRQATNDYMRLNSPQVSRNDRSFRLIHFTGIVRCDY